ncbi:histidinol-phosphate transaminase [Bryobacter aggregatus]|uniref:histidinol-phosphate transaminase n=1 Tax=Bryobacter aggregatus TaxID=360054 RepID=UPI00056C5091|nr:histidinol-phosphate transaminase [Bryobacter aggregatus]
MDFPELKPRAAIDRMAAYHPPSAGRAGKLRLDFNENTQGASPKVLAKIQEVLTADALTIYPEYTTVLPTLAKFFEVGEDELVMTNGTDEAIQILINAFVEDDDDVVILTPSYAMYRFYAEVAGAKVRTLPYRKDTLKFPLEELLETIRPETKAILISNPNNPTGTAIKREGMERILDAAPQAAVLIDEAYYEFCGITMLPYLNEYPNLFVSRTFSKVYGMAALRVGCLFSNSKNMAAIHKSHSPYSVNYLAAIAAKTAVEDTSFLRNTVTEVLAAREVLTAGLEKIGVPYVPSQANFVLLHIGPKAQEVCDQLKAAGILVRNRSYEIPGCVRVTVGSQEQTRRFLTTFEPLWKEIQK